MPINRNIKFLKANDIDFIISYRLKTSSKEFKKFALDETAYKQINLSVQYIKNMNITITKIVKELIKIFEEELLHITFLRLKKIKKIVEI
ncbi:hypothetical protein [Mycoplasma phocimorsus]|uniref:hypothetical protein n=1 Tax=Mycoplasma phocimorsus TaxID=3045839 RepID=UPI0032201B7E